MRPRAGSRTWRRNERGEGRDRAVQGAHRCAPGGQGGARGVCRGLRDQPGARDAEGLLGGARGSGQAAARGGQTQEGGRVVIQAIYALLVQVLFVVGGLLVAWFLRAIY